jgi:hypothetical protein
MVARDPRSYVLDAGSTLIVPPTLQDAVREAQATHSEGDRIRLGLTDFRSIRIGDDCLFALCPNVTLAVRQLTQLVERCKATSKPDPIYCTTAAYHGTRDRPDIGFADAVPVTFEQRNAANFNLPTDAYSDACDIAPNMPTRKPHTALSAPALKPDDHTGGWSSTPFADKSTRPNGTFLGE